jgi:hypothetical protein
LKSRFFLNLYKGSGKDSGDIFTEKVMLSQ